MGKHMSARAAPAIPLAELAEQARAARDKGDIAAARGHLDLALAHNPCDAPTWLKLLEAEILGDEGRVDASRQVLEALRLSDPDSFWPAFQLANLTHKQGDLGAARVHLDAALAQPEAAGNAWIRLLQANLLRDEGRDEAAKAVLERTVQAFPKMMWLHHRLGQIAEARQEFSTARAHYEDALRIDGSHLSLQLSVVRLLDAEGMSDAARARLEQLRDRFGGDVRILLQLARAYQSVGKTELEQACLTDAIAADPVHPGLLRHLFATRARFVPAEDLVAVTDGLRARVDDRLVDDLLISSLLQQMQFHDALTTIRRDKKTRDTAAEAHRLAMALFGAHRYETGLRYVRRCLRRWPAEQKLWLVYVTQSLKLGRIAEVARQLEIASRVLPDHVLLDYRLILCGYRNDLDGAVECYAGLRDLGLDKPSHRTVLGKLVYTRQDPLTAGALFERIGNPGAEDARLLHRGGLVGMMTLEFGLERQALEQSGGYGSVQDWVRSRPCSTVAAIRLVDGWGGQGTDPAADEEGIPRQIFQYWDNPDRPDALAPIVASWQKAPGFSHRLIDRIDALRFLRETFGGDWVRAFQLAQDAAQEADLLRLCLLAKSGGVWADADDYLYGDLNAVLGHGSGLILYREPLGGALANNIMASAPSHPVIVYAARLACQALLQRANENAWNKTGPGLLTRAMAHYLVRTEPGARRRITVLDWPQVGRQISTHNPVSYKATAGYWNRTGGRETEDVVWAALVGAVQG
jgi:tetratricopeptide (TPR) repeat protein